MGGPTAASSPPRRRPTSAALQATIDQLRQQLDALALKVAALEAAQAATPAAPAPGQPAAPSVAEAPAPAPAPAAAPVATAEGAAVPVYGNPAASSKVFNPDMAVIGNFVGSAGKNDIDPLPALSLNEAEVSFQAVVDPYARADFFLAASPEGLEVEEGFLTFPTLPGGLL